MKYSVVGDALTSLATLISKSAKKLDAVLDKQSAYIDRDTAKADAMAALNADNLEKAFEVLSKYDKDAAKAQKLEQQEKELRDEFAFLQGLVTRANNGELTSDEALSLVNERKETNAGKAQQRDGGNSTSASESSDMSESGNNPEDTKAA